MQNYRRSLHTFKSLLVSDKLVAKLKAVGIQAPSPIQVSLLPMIHSNRDVIIKDQTGSGKTYGLVIGALCKRLPLMSSAQNSANTEEEAEFIQRRLMKKVYTSVMFIVPTRELALQIYHWITDLGEDSSPSFAQCIFTGPTIAEQQKTLKSSIPKILIGTPKRLLELQKMNSFDISRLQLLVVDEIDRIVEPLSRYATVKDRFKVYSHISPGDALIDLIVKERKVKVKRLGQDTVLDNAKKSKLQIIVSSATINNPMKGLLRQKNWLVDPVILDMNLKTPSTVKHIAYFLDSNNILEPVDRSEIRGDEDKNRDNRNIDGPVPVDVLAESISAIIYRQEIKKALIFLHSSSSVGQFVDNLKALDIKAEKLSNMQQYSTSSASSSPFEDLNTGKVDIIVGTEFEARGLDIPSLGHVIMVGTVTPQSYIHVSGRTGRFGASGVSISLLLNIAEKNRYLSMMTLLKL